ncbi:3576_t:CDS:1, partial [Acaulospora morrowiae]
GFRACLDINLPILFILVVAFLPIPRSQKSKMTVEHHWWGSMGGPVQRGIVTYSLSPFTQKAFAGALKHGVFNVYRRTATQAPYIGIPFLLGYLTYHYAKKRHEYLNSKAGHEELLLLS